MVTLAIRKKKKNGDVEMYAKERERTSSEKGERSWKHKETYGGGGGEAHRTPLDQVC